jgi:HlyD family secretion protein
MTNDSQPEAPAEPKIEADVKPTPEADVTPTPKVTGAPPPDSTLQIVKKIHELYEELGRQNVRAAEEWEKAQQEPRKGNATVALEKAVISENIPESRAVEPKPEATAKPKAGPTTEPKPEAATEPKKATTPQQKKWLIILVGILVLAALSTAAWLIFGKEDKNKGLVSGNGRIEAVEIGVAAKTAGRVKDVLVREGELVRAGQVIALMDTEILEAERRQAQAQLKQSQSTVETNRSKLVQRGSEKEAALALVRQREAELGVSRKRALRSLTLASEAATSQQEADDDSAKVQSAVAAVSAARAQLAAAGATVVTARAEIAGAQSAVEAARATVERIQADIKDSALKAPREGRVQYRVAQPGEVVAAGGRVLSMVDLSDVYMTFFLSTAAAGRVALGTEVRLVLDAAPQYVIPAQVSFVADVAQFTPKTVETASERLKLMFRVRAQIPPVLLRKHITQVKTGLPGMAYLRMDPALPWPARLQVKLQP